MPAKKKTAAKKTASKRTSKTAEKSTSKRAGRTKRTRGAAGPKKPMSAASRAYGAKVIGDAIEDALAAEDLGVKRTSTSEKKGATGLIARILLDDGSRLTVTVAVKQK
jgi:hypothetical protein